MVPDFLSRMYLLLTTSGAIQDKQDLASARQCNKIFIPVDQQVNLIKKAHITQTGHMRLAKLYSFLSQCYYCSQMFKDVKNFVDHCKICNRIHSKIDFRHLRPVEAQYPF